MLAKRRPFFATLIALSSLLWVQTEHLLELMAGQFSTCRSIPYPQLRLFIAENSFGCSKVQLGVTARFSSGAAGSIGADVPTRHHGRGEVPHPALLPGGCIHGVGKGHGGASVLCASACFSVHLWGSGGIATFCEQGFQQSGARPVLSTCTSDGAVLGPGGMLRGRGMSRGCPEGVPGHGMSSSTSVLVLGSSQGCTPGEQEHHVSQKKKSDFNLCIHRPGKRLL